MNSMNSNQNELKRESHQDAKIYYNQAFKRQRKNLESNEKEVTHHTQGILNKLSYFLSKTLELRRQGAHIAEMIFFLTPVLPLKQFSVWWGFSYIIKVWIICCVILLCKITKTHNSYFQEALRPPEVIELTHKLKVTIERNIQSHGGDVKCYIFSKKGKFSTTVFYQ